MISRNEAGSRPSIVLLNVMVSPLATSRASTRVTLGFGMRMSTSRLKWAFSEPLLCRECQRGFTDVFLDFYLEKYDLFSRTGEVAFFACGFNDFDFIIGFNVHGNILDVLFHGEQGYRNFDHVSGVNRRGIVTLSINGLLTLELCEAEP